MHKIRAFILISLFLLPQTGSALMLNAQTSLYLVIPAHGSSSSAKGSSVSSGSAPSAVQTIRTAVLSLVNKERQKRGLATLKENPLLDRSAQGQAEDMAKRKFFAHVNPDGKTPEDRIRAAGYFAPPCQCQVRFAYGENIAKGQKTPAEVMKDWMNSPVHKANILKANFRELGVGYASGLWVQNFGAVSVQQK